MVTEGSAAVILNDNHEILLVVLKACFFAFRKVRNRIRHHR
jgi:hypothetical protein